MSGNNRRASLTFPRCAESRPDHGGSWFSAQRRTFLDKGRLPDLAACGESMRLAANGIAERFSPDEARAAARDFDLKRLPADFIDDPFPYYRALRGHDPVHRMPDGAYLITRWRDCDAVYRDPRVFSSDKKIEFRPKYGDTPLYEHHTTSLVFNDPPLHSRVRRLAAGALTGRAIAEMEPAIEHLVGGLLDRAERMGRFDLIADYAAA